MKRRRVFAIAALASLLATPGLAMEHSGAEARARVEQMFRGADGDQDGSLSAEEFEAARLGEYGVGFEAFDANSDGKTTIAEYLALFERYHPSERQPEL